MTNVHEWDVAAGNNTGTPPAGAPEGMQAGKVNDTIREIMAAVARWYQDQRPSSYVSTNVSNAYALTTNQTYAALSDIGILAFRVNAANTGAVTLNVDSLGAKTWQKRSGVAYSSGDLIADQMVMVVYNSTNDTFETVGGAAGEFDSGDSLIAMQTAAPNGWTKDTTAALDDVALRLVVGTAASGGSTAFTSVLASRTILQANLPVVNLTHSLTAASHTHSFSATTSSDSHSHSGSVSGTTGSDAHNHSVSAAREAGDTTNNQGGQGTAQDSTRTTDTDTHSHSFSDSFTTSSDAHSHTVSGTSGSSGSLAVSGTVPLGGSGTAMDFAVKYRDVIKIDKD